MTSSVDAYDLLVIGSGMAGMAAAAFAGRKGLRVVLAGSSGQSHFSSGLLDLLAVHPVAEGKVWDDPFQALEALISDDPDHPYALLGSETVRRSFALFCDMLKDLGLPYTGHADRNASVITTLGTVKRTFRVPAWMWNAERGLRDNPAALMVDFTGLKGFSAARITQTLAPRWPNLTPVRLSFPLPGPLYPEHMAAALEVGAHRATLAGMLARRLRGVEMVGFPAILGIADPGTVHEDMERLLGARVFEVPTMPPSVTGLRLKAAFEAAAPGLGIRVMNQKLVRNVVRDKDWFQADIGTRESETSVRARFAILATGRFFGKGLLARRTGVVETVFGLPVEQPGDRTAWHDEAFLSGNGHAINRAGLRVDSRFRPLNNDGLPAHERLYAVGSILAGQDWARQKCGSGLAVATAYAAVRDMLAQ
ncbi:glycerol-3-phosphate dehydrogenase subunit GlpB [Desulfonatronum sp. SC1]|uniref:glycerol-3-phosphate dehydrogenase subunit GlpB n=1 Tax=Desulfonatronum sp. SC1 TaxID=2109626 RepID=UPI000D319E9D|nr:glycerol-3-phosphate dehydrogenase subunit GlpB [Desulfonatronum sp. SC1]PTN36067.1 anaerobic glycerol-3-phosphate dehydrogenase subunit B [Desulfonatronum sp. SC1]